MSPYNPLILFAERNGTTEALAALRRTRDHLMRRKLAHATLTRQVLIALAVGLLTVATAYLLLPPGTLGARAVFSSRDYGIFVGIALLAVSGWSARVQARDRLDDEIADIDLILSFHVQPPTSVDASLELGYSG